MRSAAYVLVVLEVLVGAGCRRSTSEEASRRQIAEAFGRLPGLNAAPDPQLRAELARIVEEKATPELLARSEIPADQNAAEVLSGLFDPAEVRSILDRSAAIFPPGEFKFSPTGLEKAIRFREEYEVQRQRARHALQRPSSKFPIQYEAGFAADVSFIDMVRISGRLEAFWAAESLAGDDVASAIESLEYMFRLAACLAAEKHATARLQAAFLREEALSVLQAIVEHPEISQPKITHEQLRRLAAMVQGQLAAWTPDQHAWIGDRALGMHAYELVRAGRLMELLTEGELKQFAQEGILGDMPAAAERNVNQDELYYLEAMRKIIDACSRPYYERIEVLQSIREDLQRKRNSPEFPLVAGRLLLADMEKGHAIQARDRAQCEAWALALATAAGDLPAVGGMGGRHTPPPRVGHENAPPNGLPGYRISPLAGVEYEIARQEGLVMVWCKGAGGQGDSPLVIVPDLAGRKIEQ